MKPSFAAALILALGLTSTASAAPIYNYGFSFSDGTNTATGIVTMESYDFPTGWGQSVCGSCEPNAIVTDISFAGSPYVQQTLAESGGLNLGPFTAPGYLPLFPGYVNYFTLAPDGTILSGSFWSATECQLDCDHIGFSPGEGSLFLAHATFSQGIIDEVSLRGTMDVTPVPEPGTATLVAMGLIGLARRRSRRRSNRTLTA